MPATSVEAIDDMMTAWRRLAHSDLPYTVQGVQPGDQVELSGGRWAKVIRAIHRIPTVGYVLGRTRQKLRSEYQGLAANQLQARRRAGEPITEPVDTLEVAFCGDTTTAILRNEPMVRAARLLILELTFIDERVSPERSRANGHVHLDDLIELADTLNNEHVLLTHLSRRYAESTAQNALARLPDALRQKVTLLPRRPPWD
jgi:ribonuclease Z